MTIYTEIELRCDGGPGPYDCAPAIYARSVAQARREARAAGWLVAAAGKDLCPDHRNETTR